MADNAWDKPGFRHRHWVPIHKTNQKKPDTRGSNYKIPFLTDLSKILLCILFKRIVAKKTPTLQKKSPHKASRFYTFYTNEELYSTCTHYGRKHRQVTGNHFTAPLRTLLKNNWNSSSYPAGRWNWWKSCITDEMSLYKQSPSSLKSTNKELV